MATKTRAELKAYFETDDTPTQSQLAELIDAILNLEDDCRLIGAEVDIVAHAGGGQANAYQITKYINTFLTVAAAGDSVKCPPAGAGKIFTVINVGVESANLYPVAGGQIYPNAVDAPQAIASGEKWLFANGGSVWVGFKSV